MTTVDHAAKTRTQWVYGFGGGLADGDAQMRNLLGGKGANLAEMSRLGLPVPPGFTITTEACNHYFGKARAYPQAKPLRKRRAERCECLDSLPWHCETILPCCTQMRCGLHRNTV